MYKVDVSQISGQGLISVGGISSGTHILTMEYEVIENANDASIDDCFQLGDRIVRTTGDAKYLNHSSTPNAVFRGVNLFAIENIPDGEEIVVNYEKINFNHETFGSQGEITHQWTFEIPNNEISYSTAIGPYRVNDGSEYRDAVLVCSWDWFIYALDVHTGEQIWRHATGDRIYGRPQAADVNGDGRIEIFVPSNDGFISKLDDGGNFIEGYPCIYEDDTHFVGTVTANDKGVLTDTSKNWPVNCFLRNPDPADTSEAENNAFIEMNDGVAVGEGHLIANHTSDSIEIFGTWENEPQAGDTFTIFPAFGQDKIFMHAGQLHEENGVWYMYVVGNDSVCRKFNADTLETIWEHGALESTEPWPWIGDLMGTGQLYTLWGNLDGKFRCNNADTGELVWETEMGLSDSTPSVVPSGPAGENEIFMSGRDGHMYRFRASDGEVLARSGRPQNWKDIASSSMPFKNKDGNWKVVTGGRRGNVLCANPEDMMYDWVTMGTQDNFNSTAKFYDFDGDGYNEIVICDMTGQCHILDQDGNHLTKFHGKGAIEGMPLLADIDGDGKTEMVVSTLDGFIHCWEIYNGHDNGKNGYDVDAVTMPVPENIPEWTPEEPFLDGSYGAYHDMGPNAIMWQDLNKTIPADSDGDSVMVVEDLSGNGNDWVALSGTATRVIVDENTGYLSFNEGESFEIVNSASGFKFLHGGSDNSVCIGARATETGTEDKIRGIMASMTDWPNVGYSVWHDSRSAATDLKVEVYNDSGTITAKTESNTSIDEDFVVYSSVDSLWVQPSKNGVNFGGASYYNTPSWNDSERNLTLGLDVSEGGITLSGRIYATFIINKSLRSVDRWMIQRHIAEKVGVTIIE